MTKGHIQQNGKFVQHLVKWKNKVNHILGTSSPVEDRINRSRHASSLEDFNIIDNVLMNLIYLFTRALDNVRPTIIYFLTVFDYVSSNSFFLVHILTC